MVIVFVDDEEKILSSLRRLMNNLCDRYRVYYFTNAKDALDKIDNISADMIVADVKMPQMDGIEFLEIVKDRYPDTIRVLLTGYSDQEKFDIGTKLSHFFLWKPVSFEALKTIFTLFEKQNTLKIQNYIR